MGDSSNLKLENVLISFEGCAKIADFGLTVVQDHIMTQTVDGSLHCSRGVQERIDIYSFGITTAELVTGVSFHQQLRAMVEWDFAIVEKIMHGARPELLNSPLPSTTSSSSLGSIHLATVHLSMSWPSV